MIKIIKGDKLVCIETVYNFLQQTLFIKDEVYEVLDNDGEVFLNHILYGNEYNSFPIEQVNKKFKKI